MNVPSLEQLRAHIVNVEGAVGVNYQPLYSRKAYPAIGTPAMTFFNESSGNAPGGLEDTNMEVPSAMPSPKQMLVMAVELKPFGMSVEDLRALENRGHVQLYVGTQSILDEVGLATFATDSRLEADYAAATALDAQAAPADETIILENGYYRSRLFKIAPTTLTPNQNFKLTIDFPGGLVALPSGNENAGIIARLLGFRYQLAQV